MQSLSDVKITETRNPNIVSLCRQCITLSELARHSNIVRLCRQCGSPVPSHPSFGTFSVFCSTPLSILDPSRHPEVCRRVCSIAVRGIDITQTWNEELQKQNQMLFQCWPTVYYAEPSSKKHWVNISILKKKHIKAWTMTDGAAMWNKLNQYAYNIIRCQHLRTCYVCRRKTF